MTKYRALRQFLVDLLTYPLIVGGVLTIQALVIWDRVKGWYVE